VLVATGYFPPHLEFDFKELATTVAVINEQRKAEAKHGRQR
jgi:hypothetical protein